MTIAHLVACPACSRHVRAAEIACPFCTAALPDALRDSVPRAAPAVRLSRAALVAFGMGTLTVPTACSSSSGPVEIGNPAYGHAVPADADVAANAGKDSGSEHDAAKDSASAHDAGRQDVNVAVPYGLPAYGHAIPFDAEPDGEQ